ncbi:hypothetical protein HC761_00075 [bacterium]|nr:hypothetical protein [bacterium]
MSLVRFDQRLIQLVNQPTPGVFVAPSPATNSFLLFDGSVGMEADFIESAASKGFFRRLKTLAPVTSA